MDSSTIDKKISDGTVVRAADGYIGGIKIWGTGIMDDPEHGTKRGKGVQHLNSNYWIEDMGIFIHSHLSILQSILRYTKTIQRVSSQYTYFLNQCNVIFIRALNHGLKTPESREQWLMASWLAMAACEVDTVYNSYSKYTKEELIEKRISFYSSYLDDNNNNNNNSSSSSNSSNVNIIMEDDDVNRQKNLPTKKTEPPILPAVETSPQVAPSAPPKVDGKFIAPIARIDLLPQVALERLSLHNELCQVKYGDQAVTWMIEGFKISKRVDSLKRHIDEAHHKDYREDAMAHMIWNFMAIHHVCRLFPNMIDIPNFEEISKGNTSFCSQLSGRPKKKLKKQNQLNKK